MSHIIAIVIGLCLSIAIKIFLDKILQCLTIKVALGLARLRGMCHHDFKTCTLPSMEVVFYMLTDSSARGTKSFQVLWSLVPIFAKESVHFSVRKGSMWLMCVCVLPCHTITRGSFGPSLYGLRHSRKFSYFCISTLHSNPGAARRRYNMLAKFWCSVTWGNTLRETSSKLFYKLLNFQLK